MMDALTLSVPVLPSATAQQMGMGLLWGVVLAWLVLACISGMRIELTHRLQWTVVLVMMALCLWPGKLSPAYWLGLSFQSPSLVLASLAAYGVYARLVFAPAVARPWAARSTVVTSLCCLGAALGWLLMLDTLAMWPRSVYALGFGAGALAVAAACLALMGWWAASMRAYLPLAGLAGALLVFALTRLPSGNVWDALSDPLLWVGLHFKLVRDVLVKKVAPT
jgi:hypothetical protein